MKAKKIAFLTTVLAATFMIYGAVHGKMMLKVTDSQGKPIQGVQITIQSTKISDMMYQITTSKDGVAEQSVFQHHVFMVTLEKEGYQAVKKNVKITAESMQKEEIIMYTSEETPNKAVTTDPKIQAAKAFNEAAALINQKKYDKAVKSLERTISLDDTIHQAHYYLGFIYFEKEKYQESLQSLLKAVELDEDNAQAYGLLAKVSEKLGKKADADKYTQLAQEKGRMTPTDAYNEGILAFNSGKYDMAIAAYIKAIELDEKFADAYYNLGMCYLAKNELDKAIVTFEKFIELKPKGGQAETAKAILDYLK